ncbi:MAG: hypothetical protein RJA79_661, partial [Actinomycetota bacterium]
MVLRSVLVGNFFSEKFRVVPRVTFPYLSIALVVSTLLTLSDVDLLTSLRTSLVIVSISTTGLIAWLLLVREDRKILFPEAIGMGLAIGFILCAGFQLVLRQYGFNIFGGLIPVIIAHFSLSFIKVRKLVNYQRLSFSVGETAAVLFTIFFGLYLNAPLLLIPAAIFAYVAFDRKAPIDKKFSRWSTQLSYLSIWLTIVLGFILIALTTTVAAPYIFGNSSESIPREAWSNSIIVWGPNENIPLFGNPLRYHWFSFAVFGLITHLSGLAPMVLSNSGLAGMLDCLCVGSIVWSMTYYLSKDRRTALLSVVILYGTVSLNQPYAILADSSPDATSWLVWVVAFGFALTIHTKSSLKFAPLVFSLIGVAAILSNGPHGAVLLVGMFGWLLGRWLQNEKIFNQDLVPDLKIIATAAATMLLAYYLFLTPSQYSASTIDFSLRFLKSWPGFLFVLTIYGARFVALPILHKTVQTPLAWFYYGISVSGLAAFFIYRNSIWNLANYFIFPGLVLMPILIAMLFASHWRNSQFTKNFRWIIASAFFVFGSLLHILTTAINWKQEIRLNALSLSEYFVIFPPIAIGLLITLSFYIFRRTSHNTKTTNSIFLIATVFCSLGVGLGYSVRTNVRDLVDMRIGRDYGGLAKPTTSYEFRDAMLWLQRNSKQDDLVATNFIAGTKVRDFFTTAKFPSSNLAISAISKRRVLIEGDAWGNVGLVFNDRQVIPGWLNDRLRMSHLFAKKPEIASATYMRQMNINWFVVDKSKQMPTTWEPYASIAFENSEV